MFTNPICNCAPDADWHEYDVWGEGDEDGNEGSLEGSTEME